MTAQSRPARTGIQTCKENIGIAGREPNVRSEKQPSIVDKGLYLSGLRCGATGLYTTGCSSEAIFSLAGRLAGSGKSCHLQGYNGGVAA